MKFCISAALIALAHCAMATSSCDNSQIQIKNNTNTSFQLQDYYPRSGTKIDMTEGNTTLLPGGTTSFLAQSGLLAAGDALGGIEFKGNQREYAIYYFFSNYLSFGSCSVRADVTTDKYDFCEEKYDITCQGNSAAKSPTLKCEINSVKILTDGN